MMARVGKKRGRNEAESDVVAGRDKGAAKAAPEPAAAPSAAPRKRGRTVASGNEGAKSTPTRTRALLQVGDGEYRSFKNAALMTMDAADLLTALAMDPIFRGKLATKDVVDFRVFIGRTASDEEPTSSEEAAAKPLKGVKTVGAQAAGMAAKANLFIRVCLPAPAAAAAHALVGLPATHPLGMFAAAVAAAAAAARGARGAVVLNGKSSIRLPEGVSWPDLKSNVLYVRYFYKPLWETVLQRGRVLADGADGCIILGTPGIAKSAFGLYALFRAIMDGRTVVYDSAKAGFAVFKNGQAYTTQTAEIAINVGGLPELADARTLYISDGKSPAPSAAAYTVLISSPKRKIWSKFSQTPGHSQFVLPPMKKREIFELREAAFPSLNKTEVALLVEKWGGNARNTLTYGRDLAWQAQLEEAPAKQFLAVLERALEGASSFDSAASGENIHRVVNLIPRGALKGTTLKPTEREFYVFDHAELASPYVAGLFAATLMQKNERGFTRFLHALKTEPEAAPFYGKLYERTVVTARLRHGGGKLPLVRLSPAGAADAPTPALLSGSSLDLGRGVPLVRFDTAADLRVKWASHRGDAVFMPLSSRFHVIDFVMRLNNQPLLLNSTVSDSHAIKIQNASFREVLDAVGLLVSGAQIPFLWVLPEEPHRLFKAPGPIMPGSARDTPVARRLVQYKLLLKVPTAPAPLVIASDSDSDSDG